MPRRHLLIGVTCCWVLSFLVLVTSVWAMRSATGLPRIVPMSGLDLPDAYDPRVIPDGDLERFRLELEETVEGLDEEARVLAILAWVMNQVPRVENRYSQRAWGMIEAARAGGGFSCGGMAEIFRVALLAHAIPARVVMLQRNLFDTYDTHASVEAWVRGKWRLYDPTFHVALRRDDEAIGLFEARDWVLKGKGAPYEIAFLGEVRYPARIENYPIRLEAYMNNAYVLMHRQSAAVNVPVVGFWLTRELAYSSDDDRLSHVAQTFYRRLYYGTLVVLPAVNLCLLLVVVAVWRAGRSGQGLLVRLTGVRAAARIINSS
jgi:hypothetical protein